mmetsp:Transcript_10115/g.30036  ORF Transcript_10115/g.30036 Transcript_10115/m.30036 type:complete len:441 (-) Transcript_10115:136-1458(-)
MAIHPRMPKGLAHKIRLLPSLGVIAAALAVATGTLRIAGWAFQAPAPGRPSLTPRGIGRPAAAPAPLAQGAPAWGAPAAVGKVDGDSEQSAAPASLIFAATALAAAAAAVEKVPEDSAEKTSGGIKATFDKVKLPIFVGLWYFFNVQYNIQNKMLLKCFSATWAVSWLQLAAGIPIAMLMWLTGFVKTPSVTTSDVMKLAPVGAAFALGQVATVASLGAVAVSFTHVVKALEPAVNAIASALVLGQVFHPMVYASLAPVFLGVALASSSELSFTMFGFLTAMASNFAFVTRNVLATKFGSVGDMGEDKTERKTNQLAVLTAVAAAVLLPVALFLPGGLLSIPSAWAAAVKSGVPAGKLAYMMAASGFHFFMYQLSSFWVLSCVPPITHSVLNTLKRVVIIVVSIFVFRTPVTTQSAIGTATAIGGVLLYSLTKAHYAKKK